MSGSEINIKTVPAPVAVQQKPAAPTGPASADAQPLSPAEKAPDISIQDVSRVVTARKDESLQQLNETLKHLDDAIEALNAAVKKVPTSLHFSVDDTAKRFVVQVTDTNTGEIIRKVPGDAILRIARQIESLKGVLFDEKF
jgi:flagellar protein FlaG